MAYHGIAVIETDSCVTHPGIEEFPQNDLGIFQFVVNLR